MKNQQLSNSNMQMNMKNMIEESKKVVLSFVNQTIWLPKWSHLLIICRKDSSRLWLNSFHHYESDKHYLWWQNQTGDEPFFDFSNSLTSRPYCNMLIASIKQKNYPHMYSDKHIAAKVILECVGEIDSTLLE